MKLVYMGTPEFAVCALRSIIEAGHEVAAVFTQPDKPKGRSKALVPTPVKEEAIKHNIPVYQPEKLRDIENVELIKQINPELIVVAAYGQILPESILNIPEYGCVNIHASLLPKYRGAAPIEWAILNGEEESGVTTMYMAKGLDTGDMIDKAYVKLDKKETGLTLHDKLADEGARLILKTIDELKSGKAVRIPQDDSQSCYASMLNKEMGIIDFNKSAVDIDRQVRGLIPWPCAYTKIDGKTVQIFDVDIKETGDNDNAGEIIEITKKSFTIACGRDAVVVKSLKPEGKKQMPAAAYLNGNKLKLGMKVG